MGRRKGEKGSEGLKRMDDMGARGGKKSRVESEKRNRAEVRRTDSIVPWWNGERERERAPFVGLPFPCLVGRTPTVRGTFLGKSVAAFWSVWPPIRGNGNNRPSSSAD